MTEQSKQETQGLGCDPHHPAVGSTPAWLSTARHRTPQGEFLIATFRVPNATLTTLLSKADLKSWIDQFQKEHDQMSSLVVAPPGAALPPMGPNGHVR